MRPIAAAVAVLSVVLLAGCSGSADDRFIDDVASVWPTDRPIDIAGAKQLGHNICDALDAGTPMTEVILQANEAKVDPDVMAGIITAAIEHYCPHQMGS